MFFPMHLVTLSVHFAQLSACFIQAQHKVYTTKCLLYKTKHTVCASKYLLYTYPTKKNSTKRVGYEIKRTGYEIKRTGYEIKRTGCKIKYSLNVTKYPLSNINRTACLAFVFFKKAQNTLRN